MNDGEEPALPCAEKLVFDTQKEANAAANVAEFRYGTQLHSYKCRYCHLWHLSSGSRDD